MERQSYQHGEPSWVDLSSTDKEKAAAFYGALWGWQFEDQGPDAGGYMMAFLNGKPVAGLGPQFNPQMPSMWNSYINVENVDDVAAKAGAAGGQVYMPPMDVMDAGRMAMIGDPTGAPLGLWQAGNHKGAGLAGEPGTLVWVELLTTNVDQAKSFFGQVIGWGAHTSTGPMEYTEFQVDGRSVAGLMAKPPEMPAEAPAHWAVNFAVTDVDATAAKVAALGGTVLLPPMDTPAGRYASFADPTGAAFNVIALTPEYANR